MTAAVWRRVVATIVDFVLVPVIAMIVMLVSGVIENAEAWAGGFPWLRVFCLGVVGYLLVNGFLLWRHGQTLGKWLAKIKIVDHDSGRVPAFWKLIVLRAPFFPLLHATFIGYGYLLLIDLLVGLRRDRRCVHDWVSGTRVVDATEQQ